MLHFEHELITVPIGLHSPFQLKVPDKLDNTYSDDKNGYMFNLQMKTFSINRQMLQSQTSFDTFIWIMASGLQESGPKSAIRG